MAREFSQRVYDLALSIPPGRVTTYGAIAKAAGGGSMASRSITGILSKAPNPNVIPWHRIVYAGGKVWMNPEYEAARLKLYKREGIKLNDRGYIIDFEEIFYDFSELN
ncbi:MGMT family protein [Patescibacteria group bacterium]|nr:MGMT family protein [Patescibacteria group bacterium]